MDAPRLYARVRDLARAQSDDVAARLCAEGVEVIAGTARLAGRRVVAVGDREIQADAVLIATGAQPRVLPGAVPDGDRVLTWRQLYDLAELPPNLIVVGSGVTGAEFAGAYQALGSAGHAGVLARARAAARGRRRRHGRRGGVPPPRHDRAGPLPRRRGPADRGRRGRHPGRRPDRARLALPAHRRHGAQHHRPGPGGARRHRGQERVHPRGPGVPDLGRPASTPPGTAPGC